MGILSVRFLIISNERLPEPTITFALNSIKSILCFANSLPVSSLDLRCFDKLEELSASPPKYIILLKMNLNI